MQLQVQKKVDAYNLKVRLSEDLNQFVIQISEELNCSKSEAVRSMIKACRAGFKKEAEKKVN